MSSGMGAGRWKAESAGWPEREQDAEDAAGDGEQHAFSEHLAEQLGARGSEGEADGHLALTAGGLGEEQIGDVGAGDAEDQEHDDASAPRTSERWTGRSAAANRPDRRGSRCLCRSRDWLWRNSRPACPTRRRPGRG